jgi:hypothetical protein
MPTFKEETETHAKITGVSFLNNAYKLYAKIVTEEYEYCSTYPDILCFTNSRACSDNKFILKQIIGKQRI